MAGQIDGDDQQTNRSRCKEEEKEVLEREGSEAMVA